MLLEILNLRLHFLRYTTTMKFILNSLPLYYIMKKTIALWASISHMKNFEFMTTIDTYGPSLNFIDNNHSFIQNCIYYCHSYGSIEIIEFNT